MTKKFKEPDVFLWIQPNKFPRLAYFLLNRCSLNGYISFCSFSLEDFGFYNFLGGFSQLLHRFLLTVLCIFSFQPFSFYYLCIFFAFDVLKYFNIIYLWINFLSNPLSPSWFSLYTLFFSLLKYQRAQWLLKPQHIETLA